MEGSKGCILQRWAKELCDVLGYLHSQNPPIIYRDMKPANVMLRPDGHIALIDFGTAKEFKEFNVKDTISFGTIGMPHRSSSAERPTQERIFTVWELPCTIW